MAVGILSALLSPPTPAYKTDTGVGVGVGVGSACHRGAKSSIRRKGLRVGLWSVRRATGEGDVGVTDESLT